ncbi:hypothetical protein ES702_07577 [subsurface metagenome]
MAERRVFLCSGKPPLTWKVSNKVGSIKRHTTRRGILSLKAVLFTPCQVGTCKIICYDRRGYRAETSLIRVLFHNKDTAKNAYGGIFVGTEVRKQLGKTVIFRRKYGHQQKFPYFKPMNPRNPAKQQPWRMLFKDAMAAAQNLTEEEREYWKRENLKNIWHNNFISFYLKTHPKPW